MSLERLAMYRIANQQIEAQQTPEAMQLRERFFVPASLQDNEVFCMDDRLSENDLYIGVAGGLGSIVNGFNIMRAVHNPNGIEGDFASDTATISKILIARGLKFGVHSDEANEHGKEFHLGNPNDSLGCAFEALLTDIQKDAYDNKNDRIDETKHLAPWLFREDGYLKFANEAVDAGARLAESSYYSQTTPRKVAEAAVESGAPSMVVLGSHSTKSIGILNFVGNTTYDTVAANLADVPAYEHSSWAVAEAQDDVRPLYPYDPVELAIVDTITAVAALRKLGVNEIYPRLAQAA